MTLPFRFALYAITKHGIPLAEKIRAHLPADLWVSERLAGTVDNCLAMPLPMGPKLAELIPAYDCHIFIISVGAVIRMVAPSIKDKKTDPAIICIDDKGQYVIPILSGHVGRANEFARRIAEILGAQAIITTASDVQNTLSVDILGREKGWVLAHPDRNVTRGCAAVVNEEDVLVVQEVGEPDFWPLQKALPKGVKYALRLEEDQLDHYVMILLVSDRSRERLSESMLQKTIIYHPKTLVVGIGCDRDTPFELLERGFLKTLQDHGLAIPSVKSLATIAIKAKEPALLQLCEKYTLELIDYPPEYLDATPGIQNPSATVKKFTGSQTVAEGASLRASGAATLLIPKQKYNEGSGTHNMTIAVSRIPHPTRFDYQGAVQ